MDSTPTDLDHPQCKRFRASPPLLSKLPLTLLRHAKPRITVPEDSGRDGLSRLMMELPDESVSDNDLDEIQLL